MPANCTGYGQAADRPQTNQSLKGLTGWGGHVHRVEAKLAGNFEADPTNLNRKAKELISSVLVPVRDTFNDPDQHYSGGIKRAFEETVLGDPHRELAELLEHAEPIVPAVPGEVVCPYGCGQRWQKETRAYQNHHEVCWYTRPKLYEPLQFESCNQRSHRRDTQRTRDRHLLQMSL